MNVSVKAGQAQRPPISRVSTATVVWRVARRSTPGRSALYEVLASFDEDYDAVISRLLVSCTRLYGQAVRVPLPLNASVIAAVIRSPPARRTNLHLR